MYQTRATDPRAPVVDAELWEGLLFGHSVYVCKKGCILPTEGSTPDLFITADKLGSYRCRFQKGSAYEAALEGRVWTRCQIGSPIPLS